MKLLLLLGTLFFSFSSGAQTAKGSPMPPFRMMQSNGRAFEAADLQPNRPVVLIYFAPDCDHCLVLLEAFFKNMDTFKNAEVVLVTFKPSDQLIPFEKKYNTARFPNLHIGTEGYTFFLRNYYRMQRTPFVALYNGQRRLACSFPSQPPVPEIIRCFKTIQ